MHSAILRAHPRVYTCLRLLGGQNVEIHCCGGGQLFAFSCAGGGERSVTLADISGRFRARAHSVKQCVDGEHGMLYRRLDSLRMGVCAIRAEPSRAARAVVLRDWGSHGDRCDDSQLGQGLAALVLAVVDFQLAD